MLVVGSLFHVDDGDPFRQLHLLGPPLAPGLAGVLVEGDEIPLMKGRDRRPAALSEPEDVVALDAVEEIRTRQRLEGGAHARLPADDIAGNGVGQLGDLDVGEAEPGPGTEIGDDGGKGVALAAAAVEEQPRPAGVGPHQHRVGEQVIDLGAPLGDLGGPDLVVDQGAGGGIDLDDAGPPHQRPALALEAASTEERALVIDLDRRHRLPDDAVAFPPLDRIDVAARSAVGHPDLEDDAVVGGIVGKPAGLVVEPVRTGLDVVGRKVCHLLERHAEGDADQLIVSGVVGDGDLVKADGGVGRAGTAAKHPALAEAFEHAALDTPAAAGLVHRPARRPRRSACPRR